MSKEKYFLMGFNVLKQPIHFKTQNFLPIQRDLLKLSCKNSSFQKHDTLTDIYTITTRIYTTAMTLPKQSW